MSVKTNIPKAMREFEQSMEKLMVDTQKLEASLAVQAMDEVRKSGLIKGALKKNSKTQYDDIQSADTGIIIQRRKSQKGKTRDRSRYKYYGKVRNRERKYAERDRGPLGVKRVFHKKRVAVRTGDFYTMFEKSTKFTVSNGVMIQNRRQARIRTEKFNLGKDKDRKSISFEFFGTEGKSLRMLSYGKKRDQPLTIDNGKQLKGRKGKRDIVANALRKTFNRHNRMIQKYVDSNYAKRFNKIK